MKLFYENQYIKDFTAEITNVVEKDGNYHVVLDKTYFYPEGGGQPCDLGYIESHKVSFVYEENDVVYHILQEKPIKIHRVKCKIDWQRRFDAMQQHLGQHILSASINELFNGETVGFHLGSESCTLDINKFLTKEEIEKAEKRANEIILENIELEILFPKKSELKKMNIKKDISNIFGPVRIVKIADLDLNPCCGVHPKSTLEVQAIKVKKFEKYKNNTRIEFFSGSRAINFLMFRDTFASQVCKFLGADESGALNQIEKLSKDLKNATSENKDLKAEIANYEVKEMINSCESINAIRVIKKIYDDQDMKYLNVLASKLTQYENVIVLFALKGEANSNMLFMCSKTLKSVNMNELLKDSISLIDGKGGGSAFSAQGGGKSSNNLESAMDYAFMKLKNSL